MIEQSSVHLPELVKDIGQPVSIYLVHLSRSFRFGLGPQASRREDSLSGRKELKETGCGGRGQEACGATTQFVDQRGGLRTTAQRPPLRSPGGLKEGAKPKSSEAKEEEVMIPTQLL
jgi:hypothetical protein